jgi:hypothetical protein
MSSWISIFFSTCGVVSYILLVLFVVVDLLFSVDMGEGIED